MMVFIKVNWRKLRFVVIVYLFIIVVAVVVIIISTIGVGPRAAYRNATTVNIKLDDTLGYKTQKNINKSVVVPPPPNRCDSTLENDLV